MSVSLRDPVLRAVLAAARWKLWPCLAMCVAVHAVLAGSTSAQQAPTSEQSPRNCSSEEPHRECSAFWVTEAGFTLRLRDDTVLYPSFELGRLWNVGATLAPGLTGYVGYNDGFLAGLKPRVRTWLGPNAGLDVAAGVLCCNDRYQDELVVSGHVGIVVRDLWTVVVQVERQQAYRSDRGTFYRYDGFLGGKIGSAAGIWTGAATAVVGAGILIWLISTI